MVQWSCKYSEHDRCYFKMILSHITNLHNFNWPASQSSCIQSFRSPTLTGHSGVLQSTAHTMTTLLEGSQKQHQTLKTSTNRIWTRCQITTKRRSWMIPLQSTLDKTISTLSNKAQRRLKGKADNPATRFFTSPCSCCRLLASSHSILRGLRSVERSFHCHLNQILRRLWWWRLHGFHILVWLNWW